MEKRKTEGAFMWPSNPVVLYGPTDDVELELKNKMEEFAKKKGFKWNGGPNIERLENGWMKQKFKRFPCDGEG
jgi:hypothetical protein